MAYAATFDVTPPEKFEPTQVLLRVVIAIVLGFLQIWNVIFGGMYLILPVVAAVLISQKKAEGYFADAETGPVRWLRYLMMIYAYMGLATDRLQTERPEEVVQLNIQPTGTPTVGSALLRIILGIPHGFVLGILGIVFAIVWLISAVSIIISGTQPEWALSFIQGYLRWTARFFAYMASLVDEYPPFSFENGGSQQPAQPAPPTPEQPQ
jgi:hypothetical protein